MSTRNAIVESQVISYIIQNKDMTIIDNNQLKVEDFTKLRQPMVKFIMEHRDTYGVVPDEHTIISKFPDDYERVIVEESPLYLEKELLSLQREIKAGMIISQNAAKLNGSAEEKSEAIKAIADGFLEISKSGPASKIGTDLVKDRTRVDRYLERHRGEAGTIATLGIPGLDEKIGGIFPDDLFVIYARLNQGKSYLMAYFATALFQQGYNILFYSGEMSADQVGYRYDAIQSGVSNKDLLVGRELTYRRGSKIAYGEYLNTLAQRDNWFRVITPEDDLSGNRLNPTDVGKLMDDMKPDFVFIDQLSLMQDNERSREERRQYINIMRDLRQLCGKKHIPIFAAAQANRQASTKDEEGEFQIPEVAHLAESDAVGQFATRALGLCVNPHPTDEVRKIVKMGVTKDRNGSVFETEMVVDFDKGEFIENIPEPIGGSYIQPL